MDLFKIPQDDGKAFRRKVVQHTLKQPYVDGAMDYCLLVPYAEQEGLSDEQRIWLAYLYGLSYSCTTAIRMFDVTSDINTKQGINRLARLWEQKESLYFSPDKRRLKSNNQVLPAICDLKRTLQGRSLLQWVQESSQGGESFDSLYRAIQREWKFFGPMGSYLFFDALYGLCPEYYADPTNLDWVHCGKTVVEGMAHMMYQDELVILAAPSPYPLDRYDRIVNKLQKHTQAPKVHIESVLCAFRKYFKGTRYLGYYADRMLEECTLTDQYMPTDVWKLRRKAIPKSFRGEDMGWKGIRKERLTRWLKEGRP